MTLRTPLALLTLAAVALLFIMLKSVQRHGQIVKEYIQWGDTETFRSDMTSETQSNGELLADAIPPLNDDSVRIYIGVVTAWWKQGTRAILREAYDRFPHNSNSSDVVTIRYVLGQPPANDTASAMLLEWEQERHGDLHMIGMEENMNDGKSYEFIYSMGKMFPSNATREERRWDYVMKVDDDALLHIPNLLQKLRPMRRKELWLVLPETPFREGRGVEDPPFLFGSGYLFSWDLITWLTENRGHLERFIRHDFPEDQSLALMMRWSGLANKYWTTMEPEEYSDYPGTQLHGNPVPMTKDMILVHRVKTPRLLAHAIECFLGMGSCDANREVERN